MPLGSFRLNSLSRYVAPVGGNLFTEGAGSAASTNTYTFTVGTAATITSSAAYFSPECAYTNHMSESGGVASSPGINLVWAQEGVAYRRLAYRSSTGTGVALTQGTATSMGGSYTGSPSRMFVVGSRYDAGSSNWTRGRYLMYSSGAAATAGYFWNASSTGQSNTAASLTWHSTATHIYYGGTMTGVGSAESFFYHEWYRDSSNNLVVKVNSAPKNFTTVYTETATVTTTSQTHISNLKDCVKGLGAPANTRGISFMFNVNTTSGKDELIICNGYVTRVIQNIFGYTGITGSATIDNIHSVTVSKFGNQGAISYWNNTTKKLDIAMFTVSCPNTTTIDVTWGSLFTHTMTNESKARLGKGNSAGRFTITTVNSANSGLSMRVVNSTGVNNLTISSSVATIGTTYTNIVEHTAINRFIDGANGDNTMFVAVLNGTTLYAHAINRA